MDPMALPQKQSQKPVAGRKDPPTRLLEGYHSTRLVNADPKRVYRFANERDQDTGIPLYEHLGFQVEIATEGGVQMAIKKTKLGERIEFRGHVLMSADSEEQMDRWKYMQAEADKQEKAITKNRGGHDPLRGINAGVLARGELSLVNETTELGLE